MYSKSACVMAIGAHSALVDDVHPVSSCISPAVKTSEGVVSYDVLLYVGMRVEYLWTLILIIALPLSRTPTSPSRLASYGGTGQDMFSNPKTVTCV